MSIYEGNIVKLDTDIALKITSHNTPQFITIAVGHPLGGYHGSRNS